MTFCVVGEISGQFTATQYRAAFDAVQKRHSALQVAVNDDPERGLVIVRATNAPLVDIVPLNSGVDWSRLVEHELSKPFPANESPLMRATVLHDETQATVVLSFNHTLADGRSAVYILRDLIEALAGIELGDSHVMTAIEDGLPSAGRLVPMLPPGVTEADLQAGARRRNRRSLDDLPAVYRLALERVDTERVVASCRAKGCTLHAALSAALFFALRKAKEQQALTVQHAVDVRPLLHGVEEECGLFVSIASTTYDFRDGLDFWSLARRIVAEIAPARTTEGLIAFSNVLAACAPAHPDRAIVQGFADMLNADSVISNLGLISMETPASVRLEAVWGPFAQRHIPDERTIGVATRNGRLRLTQTGPASVDCILEDLWDELRLACGS